MLPLIELKLTALAVPLNDPLTGNWVCNGHAVALHIDRLRVESKARGLNLDGFLSHQLARGFSLNYLKRPILVWFGLRFDCAILTFSDKLDRYYPEWAREIPGYFESGRDSIDDSARPFAYWSGQNLHRLYPAESLLPFPAEDGSPVEVTDDMEFVSDLGSGFGWTVDKPTPLLRKVSAPAVKTIGSTHSFRAKPKRSSEQASCDVCFCIPATPYPLDMHHQESMLNICGRNTLHMGDV